MTTSKANSKPEVSMAARKRPLFTSGTNQTASLIDLPIAREAGTDYPYIPGSGMKGALRDTARLRYEPDVREEQFEKDHKLVRTMFGAEAGTGAAGQLLVSDARLAFLPLRSLDRAFVWATCPTFSIGSPGTFALPESRCRMSSRSRARTMDMQLAQMVNRVARINRVTVIDSRTSGMSPVGRKRSLLKNSVSRNRRARQLGMICVRSWRCLRQTIRTRSVSV